MPPCRFCLVPTRAIAASAPADGRQVKLSLSSPLLQSFARYRSNAAFHNGLGFNNGNGIYSGEQGFAIGGEERLSRSNGYLSELVAAAYVCHSDDEREMCARTICCTDIYKKVTQADMKLFFESICGEKMAIQPAHYHWVVATTATCLSTEVAW